MAQTTILHHYVPSARPEDQAVTWAGLALIRENPRWRVVDVAAYSDYSWATELEKLWDLPGSIVNVDQDIAIHPAHLQIFETCPHDACVFAYYVNYANLPHRDPRPVHRVRVGDHEPHITEGEEWADIAGGGLYRLREPVRRLVTATPRVPHVTYRDQDWMLSVRLGVRWHVHWPAVAHHHFWL